MGTTNQQEAGVSSNMAMQFMQAVQRSVHQVVSTPYFGYEWVQPDYHFDALLEDSSARTSDESKSAHSHENPSNPTVNDVEETQTATLSPRTMEELYQALEEYSDNYS